MWSKELRRGNAPIVLDTLAFAAQCLAPSPEFYERVPINALPQLRILLDATDGDAFKKQQQEVYWEQEDQGQWWIAQIDEEGFVAFAHDPPAHGRMQPILRHPSSSQTFTDPMSETGIWQNFH